MKPIYRQTLNYQDIQDRIVREGNAAGAVYAFCNDGAAYLGIRQSGQERFSPVDSAKLETIVDFSDYLSQSAALGAAQLATMQKERSYSSRKQGGE